MELTNGSHAIEVSNRGGSVNTWKYQGIDLLSPPQEYDIEGEKKVRGGVFGCSPNFGPADAFGLPQHGHLRGTDGEPEQVTESASKTTFIGPELFGVGAGMGLIQVESSVTDRGFTFSLETSLHKTAQKSLFINPALHPYFPAPEGHAFVTTDQRYVLNLPSPVNQNLPFAKEVIIEIPGLGTLKMYPKGFDYPGAMIVLWSDHTRYFCVEPAVAPIGTFGQETSPELVPGASLTISCEFVAVTEEDQQQ